MRLARRCLVFGLLALLPLRVGAQTQFPPTVVPPGPPSAQPPAQAPAPTTPPVPDVPQPGGAEPFVGTPTADPYNSVILDNADTALTTNNDVTVLRGDVRVRYRGYTLTSDRADIDMDRETALFTGNVHLLTPNGDTVQGGRTGRWRWTSSTTPTTSPGPRPRCRRRNWGWA